MKRYGSRWVGVVALGAACVAMAAAGAEGTAASAAAKRASSESGRVRIPANGKLKIFILSGQSNMVGYGQLQGGVGTMEHYLRQKPDAYGHLADAQGEPVTRDDVWIVDLSRADEPRQGWLTVGYGAHKGLIGPEYGFGFVVGDAFEDPVLLIKSAWGGKSLFHNFLPPSAGNYPPPQKDADAGFY